MPRQRFIDARKLRRKFNRGRYWERLQAGQLVGAVGASGHPVLTFEPFCTVSQIVRYFTPAGEKVAVVHQYVRPDGTLGASGRPDPKVIMARGVLYTLDPVPPQSAGAPSNDTFMTAVVLGLLALLAALLVLAGLNL
jgi:hypothetical protein